MFCSSCGKKITENSKFCKYCGASQTETGGKNEYIWVCDYCGEEFDSKKECDKHELSCSKNSNNKRKFFKNNSQRAWFYLWIITLLVFVVSLLISKKFYDNDISLLNSNYLLGLWVFNILVGINAFLAMIIHSFRGNNKASFFTSKILIISLAYFFINTSVFAVEGFKAKNNEEYRKEHYVATTPTPISTIEVKTTPTVTPKKTVKPVQKAVDTDPIVNCTMSAECGGSTRKVKESECKNGTCCQIGSSWIFYTSRQKCLEDQAKYNSGNNNNKYVAPTSTYKAPTSKPAPTTIYVAPTSTYKAQPTNVPPTSIPIPTINQAKIDAEIGAWIDGCIGNCGRSGEAARTDLRIKARANGTLGSSWYEIEMAKIDTMVNQCIYECKK